MLFSKKEKTKVIPESNAYTVVISRWFIDPLGFDVETFENEIEAKEFACKEMVSLNRESFVHFDIIIINPDRTITRM